MPSRGPGERVDRLLASLADQTAELEAVVVDNASEGGEVTSLCDRYAFARALTLDENRGFSAAVNAGAASAEGGALVVVNDDCVLDPAFVERLVAALDPAAGVTMAAGVLRSAADPALIDTAGLVVDRTLLAYDHLSGEPLGSLEGAADPFGPSGAAAAYDRGEFARHGGFDEGLFAYWEDTDLALRMVRDGGRCRLAAGALGTHEHSATLGTGTVAKNRLTGFGRGYVLRKWGVLRPRRAAPVLARELGIIAGQALLDRDLSGVAARIAGWRAAEPSEAYPEGLVALAGESLPAALGRRWRRRRATIRR